MVSHLRGHCLPNPVLILWKDNTKCVISSGVSPHPCKQPASNIFLTVLPMCLQPSLCLTQCVWIEIKLSGFTLLPFLCLVVAKLSFSMESGNSGVTYRPCHYNGPAGRWGNTKPLHRLDTQTQIYPLPRLRQNDFCLKAGIQNTWVLSPFRAIFKRLYPTETLHSQEGKGGSRPWKSQKDDSHHALFCWKQWL